MSVVDVARARAGLRELSTRQIAVIGEGNDVCVHALCLRDTGINVRVGLAPDDGARMIAANDGLAVESLVDACEDANVVVISAPGHRHEEIYAEALEDSLVAGDMVVVTDPLGVRYEALEAPDDVDVVLVMPTTTSATMRHEFGAGHGVPMLVAVHQDASGHALERAAGVALALGGPRSTVVEASVDECADVAALSTSVIWGDLVDAVRASREAMEAAGISPQVAYLLGVGALAQMSVSAGVEGLESLPLDPWGEHVVASTRGVAVSKRLEQLRNGSIARGFALAPRRVEESASSVEQAGKELRAYMPWLQSAEGASGTRWR